MKTVEVLLRDHVKDLGRCGDVVRVRAGYARNFLLPNRIAVAATEDNKKMMIRRRARLDIEDAKIAAEVEARLARLEGVRVVSAERADEHGHLYGSVNAQRIAELLTAGGHLVEERDVRLQTPIRSVGEHEVTIHVHEEQNAVVTVVVEAKA